MEILVLLCFLFYSSDLLAQEPKSSSIPIASSGFTVLTGVSEVDPNENVEIANMPRYQSQSTLAICFACAASTVAQKFACDTDKAIVSSGVQCTDLPDSKIISPLGMISWANTNRGLENYYENRQIAGDPSNHSNLKLYSDRSNYSNAVNALMNSASLFSFKPESCYPFAHLRSKYGENGPLFKEVYEWLRPFYLKNRTDELRREVPCPGCSDALSSAFNLKFADEAIREALTKRTYGEFLYSLIFDGCADITFRKKPIARLFPERGQTSEKGNILPKMKELLTNNQAILINNMCLTFSNGTCAVEHSTVISGFRKVCPDNNYNGPKCLYQIKVHNCWGLDWQKKNNGGWVDAKIFIDHIDLGEGIVRAGALSWLEQK